MTATETPEQTESLAEIADRLGIPPDVLTESVLARIADNPMFLHHLEVCRSDQKMLNLLLGGEERGTPPAFATTELLSRAGIAVARWAASGFAKVSKETHEKRAAECLNCEHLSYPPANKLYSLTGARSNKSVCALCGCDVRRKAWLPTEHCPDGRWESDRTRN